MTTEPDPLEGDVTDAGTALRLAAIPGELRITAGLPPGAEDLTVDLEQFHPGHPNQKVHGHRHRSEYGERWGRGDLPIDQEWADGFKGGSAEKYLIHHPDGSVSFTAERQALHDRIIGDIVAGKTPPEHGRPIYHVLGGGPASGKTSLLDSPAGAAMRDPNTARIGLDDIRARLPGYRQRIRQHPGESAGYHEEAAWVTARATLAAQQRGLNMTLDTTGDSSPAGLLGRLNQAKAAGYRVEGHYVTVPIPTAISRAQARGESTGRYVPTAGLTAIHANISRTLPEVMPQFDVLDLYDNRGPRGSLPTRILHYDGTGPPTIDSPTLYQEFLDKANATSGLLPVPEGA